MANNVVTIDNKYQRKELLLPKVIPAGSGYTELESILNLENDNEGVDARNKDSLFFIFKIAGTMPINTEIVITPIINTFSSLDDITVLCGTITDDNLIVRVEGNDTIRDADKVKITFRFVQGAFAYTVTELSSSVKKKDEIESVSDAAYAPSWNGDTSTAASKNALYDIIASLVGAGVTSFNGRTGAVFAAFGDYTATLIKNTRIDHSGNGNISVNDIGKVHRVSAAAVLNIPAGTTAMIGQATTFVKWTAGEIDLQFDGADVIMDSAVGALLRNSTAAEEKIATVTIMFMGNNEWIVTSSNGSWYTV